MFSKSAIKKAIQYRKEVESFIQKNSQPEIIGIQDLANFYPRKDFFEKNKFLLCKKIINFFKKILKRKKILSSIQSKETFDYLIISHLTSYDQINNDNDFYFGNIATGLGKKNVLFLLINHINVDQKKFKTNFRENCIVLPSFLSFLDELKMHLKTFILLFFKNLSCQKIQLFSINNVASSVQSQRISKQVSYFVEKFKIKKVLFTFEGHSYEKLICSEVRRKNKKVICIGYQFTVLRKFQHSMFLKIEKKYFPNKILTISKYNNDFLKKNFKNKIKIYVSGLLKKEKNVFLKKNTFYEGKKFTVLVMPEGIKSEIKLFLRYCIENQNKKIIFCFRLHPIFKNNSFFKNLSVSEKANIKISKNNVDKDFKQNDYILYRGTAAVINATKMGLVPIYLNNSKEITLDPLHNVNHLHFIKFKENLLQFLMKIQREKFYLKEREKIYKFSKNFNEKKNFKNILKIIKK